MHGVGRRWWSSAGVRFGFFYAGLFGFSALAMAGFLWWATAGLLNRQTDADINTDAESLAATYALGGPRALVAALNRRINNNVEDDAIYLLADAELHPIAGNVRGWPKQVGENTEWTELPVDHLGVIIPARVHHFTLQDGSHLLIGRDVRVRNHLDRLLVGAVPWTGAIMLLMGIVGAATVRRLFGAMLADVSRTAAAISAGDLTRRVPLSGRGDEFDGLAETVNTMLDRIERLMEGVREVSNAIAHDLRTPIARARARLEDAARSAASPAELQAAVERAIADLDGLVAIFQALLRIAEIEAGARRSAFAPLDVTPLLRDLTELYEAAAEEGGRHLTLQAPARLVTFGDRNMLQQAVTNLLDNALKFSPEGSSVLLSASPAPGRLITIVVADHGPGIPPGDRERAPERFFRGEQARHAPGSGLGLALVQAVAVLHGGTLRLEDNAPGLRAVLSIPAAEPGADPSRMDAMSRAPQLAATAGVA